ncbi:MAG TPA: AraC family transcriptional regulator [Niabella sp.]|nr:AraC family transcriptional regulator [Niabella sp.]HRC01316.1 AraC family transcriptional regulator [Niabella sp.]
MCQQLEIKEFSRKWSMLASEPQQLALKEQHIPGAVNYSIRRVVRSEEEQIEDVGMVHYTYKGANNDQNKLTLRFCVTGNMYCVLDSCQKCSLGNAKNCADSIPCFDVVSVDYTASQLAQFASSKNPNTHTDLILKFARKQSFQKTVPLCCKTKCVLESLVNHKYTGNLENIYVNAQLQMLLLYSMDWVAEKGEILTCRFLNSETDREKIMQAREILIQSFDQPVTIKELSRKVAMNECYLKKGFKEMYGTTIFEFYQSQRMEHAKFLLYEKGMNVTDVSMMLGYSSISHFSTAFKKQTGLKPCELLLR